MTDTTSHAQPKIVRGPSLLVLVFVAMLSPLAMNIFLPSMLGIQAHFQTDFASVQLGLSLYLASLAVSQLIMGTLSDRYGRRPIVIAGLVLFLFATIGCIYAPNIEFFLFSRVMQGLGGSSGLILGRAIIRDMYGRDEAASKIGYVTMGMAIAPMIGPAMAGYLGTIYGWQSSFWLLQIFGALVLVASVINLSETNKNPIPSISVTNIIGSYRALFSIKIFWLYTAVSGATAGMFFAFLGGAAFVSEIVLGLTPDVYGLYFILVALGYSVGNFVSGRFAARLGVFKMILLGNILGLAAIVLMAVLFATVALHPLLLFGPMFILSLSNGLVLPSAMAGTVSVRPDLAGSAAGLSGSLQMVAGASLSYIVGVLLPLSQTPSAWPLIIAMACSLFVALGFGFWLYFGAKQDT